MIKEADDLIKSLKDFQKNVEEKVIDAVFKYEHVVLDMNTQDQLFEKGIDSNGQPVRPPYHPITIGIKNMKGQPTNRVTLRDEGDFHNSFYLKRKIREFEIDAKDEKTEGLVFVYGEEIFGLTPQNMHELEQHYIKPELEAEINKIIKS